MTMTNEAGIILRKMGEGLLSIIIPTKKVNEPSEYLVLHYCNRCKKYHTAGYGLSFIKQTPKSKTKPREIPGMHYCENCDRYHRTA